MEFSGVFSSEEWDSFSRLFFTDDYSDSTLQYSIPNESLSFCPSVDANACATGIDETLFHSSDNLYSNLFHFSQDSSGSSVFLPNSTQDSYYLNDSYDIPLTNNDDVYETIEFFVLDEENTGDALMTEVPCLSEEVQLDAAGPSSESVVVAGTESQLKRKYNMPEPEPNVNDKTCGIINENPKTRTRVARDKVNKNLQKKKRVPSKGDAEEEINNGGQNGQSSCCTSSEDDSNASQEINEVSAALNLNGKTKTSRGSATDPQSLYARKRREKINERLKILQHLVPNGTKVDISTMLEEAVDYVKFLQVQIKLLSSDDHWMYAPIAYNGMDIGFLRNIAPAL